MSALGHKRTFAVQKGMSALTLKADIDRSTKWNVPKTAHMALVHYPLHKLSRASKVELIS